MITITLPLPDTAAHAHAKGHWRPKAAATRAMRQTAAIECRLAMRAQKVSPMDRARLSLDFHWPDKRRRDVLNASHSAKAYIDGCIDAGLLPDDDWQHLAVGHILPHIDRADPRVILTFLPW